VIQLETAALATVGTVLVLYVAVLLVIGWLAARRTRGGEDFHLAGRSLGAWAAAVSSTASSESGWVTLGAVGMTFTHGVSGLWYAPGCLLGYVVNVYFVAPRIQRLSRSQGSLTLTDIITQRWGDPRHLLRIVSVVIIILAMMGYVAAQMTAAGKAFSSSGLGGYRTGVLLGALVITMVTSLGGFRGVAWTDLFQGLLMAFALVALPLYAVSRLGGLGALAEGLGAIDTDFLTATGGRVGSAAWGFIVGNLGIGLGYPGMPHVITRYMAAGGDEQVRRLRLIAILWGVAVFYGAGLCGLVARVMVPTLEDGERGLMALSLLLMPPLVAGLMLAAVISAILSTVSSQLLVAASAVSYDVVEGALGRHPDERRSLVLGRVTVAAVGVLGVLLALSEVRVVFWFVLFAWSILGASFGPLILLSLAGGRTNRHGALAGMLTGLGVSFAWYVGRQATESPGLFGWVPWICTIFAAAVLALAAARRSLAAGEVVAVVASLILSMGSWWAVQRWQFAQLYELVPAFLLAALAVGAVSLVAPVRD